MIRTILASLLLIGCSDARSKSDDAIDVADANARNALSRIDDLESQISDLETANQELKQEIAELSAQSAQDAKTLADVLRFQSELTEKHNALAEAYQGHTHPYR